MNMGIDPIFEKYCRSRGKTAFDPDAIADRNPVVGHAAAVFELWVQRISTKFPKIPKLCAGMIESASFGAAADLWNEVAVIRVHASVPTILANLIAAVLSHRNSLQSVHPHIIQARLNGFRISEDRLVETLFNNGLLFHVSRRIARQAGPIAQALCNFIFFHEFVHIRNGHVDLFRQAVGLLAMEETESKLSEGLSALDRHTMEWDADKIAHWLSSDVALSTILGRPFMECSKDQIQEAYRIYNLGLYLLFKLMELAEPRNVASRVHPTPITRMTFLLAQLLDLSRMLKIDALPEDFGPNLLRTGEVAWAMITGQEVAAIRHRADMMQSQTDDALKILSHWNVLRGRLAPFNRGITDLARPNLD
jgi:hypothetical protein